MKAVAGKYVLWLAFVGLETFAQIALKIAAIDTGSVRGVAGWLGVLAANGWFKASIAADIVNFFVWMTILRRHDLSLAVPVSSLSYVVLIGAGTLYFGERLGLLQFAGLVIIGIGIVLAAGSEEAS